MKWNCKIIINNNHHQASPPKKKIKISKELPTSPFLYTPHQSGEKINANKWLLTPLDVGVVLDTSDDAKGEWEVLSASKQ
jgi:hypothetical protein